MSSGRPSGARTSYNTTTPWAGPTPWTPPTSGPSRWPPTSAAPRNGTVVHWPGGIAGQGRGAPPVRPRDRRGAHGAGGRRSRRAGEHQGHPAAHPARGEHGLRVRRRRRAERHETQYFEMFGNRGIYHQGWTAVTKHKTPRILVGETVPAFDDDVWELYDTNTDLSQARDLAKSSRRSCIEPVAGCGSWRPPATARCPRTTGSRSASTPTWPGGRRSSRAPRQILFGGMGRLSESSVINVKNKSHAVTAEVVVPAAGAGGRDRRPGGQHRRLEPLRQGGKPKYCYNLPGRPALLRRGPANPPGRGRTRCGWSSPTTAAAGQGRNGHPLPGRRADRRGARRGHSRDDLLRGRHLRRRHRGGSVVTDDYVSHGNAFSGEVNWVQIDLRRPPDADHLITPEEPPAGRHGPTVAGGRPGAPQRRERPGFPRAAGALSGVRPTPPDQWPGGALQRARDGGIGPAERRDVQGGRAVSDCPSGARSPVMR